MTRLPLGGTDHLWGDARGWGLRPLEATGVSPERLGEMHVVSVEPGAVRGNHRHPATTEWMLLFGAPADVAHQAPDGPVEVERVDGGAPTLLEFGPGVAHAVRGRGPGVTFLVCWADGTPETDRVEPLL